MALSDALVLMEAAFSAGQSFRFYPHGTSMLPLIRQGIDSVSLIPIGTATALKKGDVVLYRRAGGQHVLHRIVGTSKDDTFIMCGDAQIVLERGIPLSSIIAVAEGFYRGDTWVSRDNAEYRKYVKKRIQTRILRKIRAIAGSALKGK